MASFVVFLLFLFFSHYLIINLSIRFSHQVILHCFCIFLISWAHFFFIFFFSSLNSSTVGPHTTESIHFSTTWVLIFPICDLFFHKNNYKCSQKYYPWYCTVVFGKTLVDHVHNCFKDTSITEIIFCILILMPTQNIFQYSCLFFTSKVTRSDVNTC